MSEKPIPVYLFLGFLEAGKTRFIQKTISNKNFGQGENILLLLCEEGFEDYDFSQFKDKNVSLHVLEEKTDLDANILNELAEKSDADIIVIEYNGMWHLSDLMINKPENWKIFQVVSIADASSFSLYVQNLKNLIADKFSVSDVVVFNRYANKADVNELHKVVRSVNRRAEIYYEADNGMMIADDIEDPLPFDIDADTLIIKDNDYAVWYGDIMYDAGKYHGKTVRFKAMIGSRPELPDNVFAVGRFVMTCCEADMQFCWLIAFYNRYYEIQDEKWAMITADIIIQHHEDENADIPILYITELYECEAPKEMIASFA